MEHNTLTAEKMIKAIEDANGYVSAACHALGCSRQSWYTKLKQFPKVQQAIDAIREKRTDYVESKMMRLIDELNPAMIIFYLKTQAKNRGYVERVEQTGEGGGPVNLNVVYKNAPTPKDDIPDA